MNVSGSAIALRAEQTLRTRQLILALAALVLAYAIPVAAPYVIPKMFPTAGGTDNKCYKFSSAERSFASLMNGERSKRSKGTMKLDPELSKAAIVHTNEMVKSNTLVHTTSTSLKRRVTNWRTVGENVGVGSTVDSLHTAFMNSPAHKENILFSSFNNVGVGVIQKDDRMWVTVIFEASSNPGTPLKMPSC
ncbi:MAG: hypothetical protein QOG54_1887 [Actinomycetota bacterium]|jgi:uncharacterized protein YkwD|nr:hypothetical protein [Actinomycetota bacterium]